MAIKYEWIGTGIEDMPTSLNYETDSVKDVKGQTRTKITTGIETTEFTPVTLNPDSPFALFLDEAVERQRELTELDVELLVVRVYKRIGTNYATGKPSAYKQTAGIAPGDFAPGNAALELSATANWTGERIHGTANMEATGEKFEPETAPPSSTEIHYKQGDATRAEFQIYYVYNDAPVI